MREFHCESSVNVSSNSSIDSMTIILPAAGEGRRLGLNSPKELLAIVPGLHLIDFSLAHIRAAQSEINSGRLRVSLKVCVVVRPGKEMVCDYVEAQLPGIHVTRVYFDKRLREWPGSVQSAQRHFSDLNLALLPDSYLSLSSDSLTYDDNNQALACLTARSLTRAEVVFGCKSCSEPDLLRQLGAVCINDRLHIIRFQDKPASGFEKYNAFWGCYGFRNSIAESLYKFLIDSVERKPADPASRLIALAEAFIIDEYYDLGEWNVIEKFRNNLPITCLRDRKVQFLPDFTQ
jgi:hypothetical protein